MTSMTARAGALQERRQEFLHYVWDHTSDPFQMRFDVPERLTKGQISALQGLIRCVRGGATEKDLIAVVQDAATQIPGLLDLLLQLAGLTRNKILTDLRAAHPEARVPGSPRSLLRSGAWPLAAEYLSRWLHPILTELGKGTMRGTLEALNLATHSSFVRQERAKRMGHEGEACLARALQRCGIAFEPAREGRESSVRRCKAQGRVV